MFLYDSMAVAVAPAVPAAAQKHRNVEFDTAVAVQAGGP